MKSASPELIAILDRDNFIPADLVTITLLSVTVYRLTSCDQAITYDGHVYTPWPMVRDGVSLTLGARVDSMGLTLYGGIDDIFDGQPLPAFAERGGFDGARVEVSRVFMEAFGDTSAGAVYIFSGRVSETSPSRTSTHLTVNSDLELLNIKLPKFVYQASCRNTLYDVGCTVNRASFAETGSSIIGSSTSAVHSSLSFADNYFTLGTIEFTSGQNAGEKRTVKKFYSGIFVLSSPLPYTPAFGDSFTAYPGCDLTKSTCRTKFSNIGNFGGVPYIPTAETGA